MDPNATVPQGENITPVPQTSPVGVPVETPPQVPVMPEEPITPPAVVQEMPTTPLEVNPSPPQEPPMAMPQEPAKKSSALMTIAIILMIIAILAVAGYFVYTKYLSSAGSLATPTSSPIAIETPTPTPDPTADWKTYTNTNFGFLFKYPDTWDTYMIGESTGSALMVAPTDLVNGVRKLKDGFGGGKSLIMTISTPNKAPVWNTDNYWQVVSESITFDGIVGAKYNINVIQDLPGFNKGDVMTSVVIKKNNSYLQADLLDQTYKETFDQILSTFQFTTGSTSTVPEELITLVKNTASIEAKTTTSNIIIGQPKIIGNYAEIAWNLTTSGGAVYWAAKVDGFWKIVTGGQEPPSCSTLSKYNFPKEFDCNS